MPQVDVPDYPLSMVSKDPSAEQLRLILTHTTLSFWNMYDTVDAHKNGYGNCYLVSESLAILSIDRLV